MSNNAETALQEANSIKKTTVIKIIICASLSVFFLNSGFLSMLFLVPVGYAVLTGSPFMLTVFASAALNIVFIAVMNMSHQGAGSFWFQAVYVTTMLAGFAWIMDGKQFSNIRTLYRFVLASAAGAVVFMFIFVDSQRDSGLTAAVKAQVEVFSSILISSSSDNEAFSPDRMFEAFKNISLRGGALLTMFFLFFINRQIVISVVSVVKKQRNSQGLASFFAPPNAVWALSISLALILASKMLRIEFIEIMAWNVFAVCVIIFMVQGVGIALFWFTQRLPGLRFAAFMLIVIMMIIPGLNTIALTLLLLLGIAENWLPIRRPKTSTPGS